MIHDLTYRARDVLVSLVLLLLLGPLLIVVALLVLVLEGRPILFAHQRPGRWGRDFTLYKFRTMRPLTDADEPDADRISRFGQLLRSTSLDELPELFNVLRGDMSLVGPRPLLPDYLDQYAPAQHARHMVRPGLTGLAQVSGRNSIGWAEKLELDVTYVRTRSHLGDLRILFRTVWYVIARKGIGHGDQPTMPRLS